MGIRTVSPPCSARRRPRRLLAPALGLCALLGCAAPLRAEDATQPLPVHGFAAADAVHALVSIAAGDAEAVAALDPQLWHRGAAIPDHDNPDLALRWTRRIGEALARCAPERRAAVLAAIERAAQADLAAHPDDPARARDFLPAPSAVAALRDDSARAFDHGDFTASLSSGRLLGAAALGEQGAARLAEAQLLSGLDERIDAALELAPPGEPLAEPLVLPPPGVANTRGLSVIWAVRPGWILAQVGGGVAWQYRVDLDAEVVTGPGAALVRDRAGTRLIREDGSVSTLTPPPAGTRLLGVGGGAAWFASGTRGWRMPIHDGVAEALALGAEPPCAPLVRGDASLWLLPDRLALFRRGALVASVRHHLAVGPAWRLAVMAHGAPAVAAPDGGTWRIEPLADQLARAEPIERARLLLASAHPADALALLGATASLDLPAARAVAFAAHVALGPAHLAQHADEAAALAPDDAARDLVRYAAWRLGDPQAALEDAKPARDLKAALAADPAAHVSWAIADSGEDEERCAHVTTAAVLLAALESARGGGARPQALPQEPLLHDRDADAHPPLARAADVELQDAQYGHVHAWGGSLIVLSHARGETILTSLDRERRTLQWRTRWVSDEDAPSRALALRDGCAVVAEGTSRLIVIRLATGSVLMRVESASDPLDPSRARIAGATMVIPAPLDDALLVARASARDPFDEVGREGRDVPMRRVALARRLRWLAVMPPFAAVLADLDGDQALGFSGDSARPDGLALTLPAGIARAPQEPATTQDGLAGTDGTYGWSLERPGER